MLRFFGLADTKLADVIEFYSSRAEAEEALRGVLQDEPGWVSFLAIVCVDFSGPTVRVLPTSLAAHVAIARTSCRSRSRSAFGERRDG